MVASALAQFCEIKCTWPKVLSVCLCECVRAVDESRPQSVHRCLTSRVASCQDQGNPGIDEAQLASLLHLLLYILCDIYSKEKSVYCDLGQVDGRLILKQRSTCDLGQVVTPKSMDD
jgi:hypothetical protein